MHVGTWVRRSHRWLGVAFTLTVVANIVVLASGHGAVPPPLLIYSPLLPLFLLMLSGLYLFVLPYLARRRGVEGVEGGVGGQAHR